MDLNILNGILGLTGKEVAMAAVMVFALGYAGQMFKAVKGWWTWLAHVGMALSTVAAWALVRLPVAGHIHEWLVQCVAFSLMAWGVGSFAAGAKLAPKTDSK